MSEWRTNGTVNGTELSSCRTFGLVQQEYLLSSQIEYGLPQEALGKGQIRSLLASGIGQYRVNRTGEPLLSGINFHDANPRRHPDGVEKGYHDNRAERPTVNELRIQSSEMVTTGHLVIIESKVPRRWATWQSNSSLTTSVMYQDKQRLRTCQ
jgi:hypothetical protein